MEPLFIPTLLDAGSVTFTAGSREVQFTHTTNASLALNNGTDLLLFNNSDTVALNAFSNASDILAGRELIVVDHDGVWTIATDATDNAFTITELWDATINSFSSIALNNGTDLLLLNNSDTVALNAGSAQAYVAEEPISDQAKAACASVDAIGLYAGRSAYSGEAAGFTFISRDGVGSETRTILFEIV